MQKAMEKLAVFSYRKSVKVRFSEKEIRRNPHEAWMLQRELAVIHCLPQGKDYVCSSAG